MWIYAALTTSEGGLEESDLNAQWVRAHLYLKAIYLWLDLQSHMLIHGGRWEQGLCHFEYNVP